EEYEPLELSGVEERADRQRRVTCDLLSFKGVVGDSACAANCLSMGKAGGRCNNGICVCRKTNKIFKIEKIQASRWFILPYLSKKQVDEFSECTNKFSKYTM
ncbi:unnamed protein product, partial [Heterotrigona itama]